MEQRQIKFKAYSITKKKMAIVISLHWKKPGTDILESGHLVFDDHESVCSAETFILREYTGLLDKNGKEIFEGDIVQWKDFYSNHQRDLIEWSTERGWWKCSKSDEYAFGTSMKNSKSDYEIIGNIWENEELLK